MTTSKEMFMEERELQERKEIIQSPKKNALALDLRHSVSDLANTLIQDVKDGYTNPLTKFEELKVLSEILKTAMERIEGEAMTIAMQNPKDIPSKFGNKIEYSEGRRDFDYSNNPSIIEAENKLKAMKELAKTIQSPVADAETGEMYYPAIVKYCKSSIKITIKNK